MPVLVIEDEPRLRDVFVSAVRELGHPAVAVSDGESAIRKMSGNPYEIVLLDLNLPGMDGMEVFHAIRDHWPNTEVIVATGYGDLDAARHAIRLNVVDFLTKPVSLGELELALHRAWRKRNDFLARMHLETASQDAHVAQMSTLLAADDSPVLEARSLEELERKHIFAALRRNKGNREAAATELGISVRTLYNKLALYERSGLTDYDV